jgi:phage-related protein
MSKPLVWLHGEIKTPPFSVTARREVGLLLRLLQLGEPLEMPHAEPLPIVGKRCGALRVRDAQHHWRVMYRVDHDAIVIVEVYSKKSTKIPDAVIRRCQDRLATYDRDAKSAE